MDAYDEERRRVWEELDMSRDELRSLTECMKKDEFRKLLCEYAEEVSDPENRRRYEAEITQLERERGVEVTFVNPKPGYVIKTSLDGNTKCFINVGQSEHVAKPSSVVVGEPGLTGATRGLNWSLPYALAPPRDDLDNKRQRCRVFDVTFHPDTLALARDKPGFKQLVNDTAIEGVENNFKVKLDRKNLRFPKMSFKGVSQPTVIRRPCEKPSEKTDMDPEIYQKLMSSYDANREQRSKLHESKPARAAPATKLFNSSDKKTENSISKYTTPKFLVKYQSSVDMDEFTDSKEAKMFTTVPKNLVIDINLPLLKSAADATLDVQDRHLSLKSEKPAKYHLELPLSHRVNPENGKASFDPKLKKLTVILPVIRETTLTVEMKEDSGVESDHGSPLPEPQDNMSNSSSCEVNSNGISSLTESEISNNHLNLEILPIVSAGGRQEVLSDISNNAFRTWEDSKTQTSFMNLNLNYSLPPFSCNVYDDVLAITIHAKNVDPESIQHRILADNAGFHVLLTTIGAGFFPVHFSLCIEIGDNMIASDTLSVEAWDNNVVISAKVLNLHMLSRYFVGLDQEHMEAKDLSAAASIKTKLQSLTEDELETNKNVEVIRTPKKVIVNVQPQRLDSDDEDEHESHKENADDKFSQNKFVSESSGDELTGSVGSSNGSGRYKSILKSRHSLFSRSVSESSIDDNTAPLSSVTFNDSIPELYSESEGSSLKKTVRFNDVVSRQLYRSNSSILGQRKKNQRKLRNKKRAHERRMSESENSETEERDKYKVDTKHDSKSDTSDAVRPILHNANKDAESQKSANIHIERSPRNSKRKQKRNAETNNSANRSDEKSETENHSEGELFECKSDLQFEIEV
ncbi:hypothetical protein QAD02_012278 [Eretmocerus hayati]|uniref:Uncharacterized protein n=1 Tax=Eretmocerus hayati TaxID=131215 RepID=A0ACC2NZ98_9HYME|nr:hypothetical protein QAD02_012278 [Eretmocerus hayati]